jgi:hypothetical protein
LKSLLVVVAATVFTATPVHASAQEGHRGVHFSADLGLVASSSSMSKFGVSEKISGAATAFSLTAGGAVTPSLIVGAQVWLTSANDPNLTITGAGADDYDGKVSGTATVRGFGPTVKYYTPSDFFVSATPSITQLKVTGGGSDESDWGLGFRGAVGKEWRVGPDVGLGVAGVLSLNRNNWDLDGVSTTWSTFAAGVVFSASFN